MELTLHHSIIGNFMIQWFSNCGTRTTSGTRRPSGWYAKRPAFCFSSQKYIHSCSFYLSGSVNKFLNFCVAYFPCCFLIMAIKISHSHFVHVGFVSILVFQTFDRMIFGTLTIPGTRWHVMTVRDTQMVRDQKKFENHCSTHSRAVINCYNIKAFFYIWS